MMMHDKLINHRNLWVSYFSDKPMLLCCGLFVNGVEYGGMGPKPTDELLFIPRLLAMLAMSRCMPHFKALCYPLVNKHRP